MAAINLSRTDVELNNFSLMSCFGPSHYENRLSDFYRRL